MGEDCFPLRQAACTTARHRKTAAQQNLVRHGQGGTEYVHNTDGRGKKGIITPQMKIVAEKERMDAEEIRSLVAKGQVIILQQEP